MMFRPSQPPPNFSELTTVNLAFSRIDARFPRNAITYCLQEAGIEVARLDQVTFYEKSLVKFDRPLETYLAFAPQGFHSFLQGSYAPLGRNQTAYFRGDQIRAAWQMVGCCAKDRLKTFGFSLAERFGARNSPARIL